MLKDLRKRIANIISPVNNSLSKQFFKYGNKPMYSDWSAAQMSDEDHYTGLLYAAINRRAKLVASVAQDNLSTRTNSKEDFVHPYLEILDKSPSFTDDEFWTNISTYLDLEGVFYLFVLRNKEGERYGNPLYFELLNPYHMRTVLDPETLKVAGYVEAKGGLVREIPEHMIIPIKELNPFDQNKNFAMTDAAKDNQFTLKTANDYTRSALRNGENAPGIIGTEVVLPPEEFENFAARVKGHVKGAPLFGNGTGAITWQSMNVDLDKAALKDVNETNKTDLISVTGLSKTLLGIEQSGTTRETARVQKDLAVEFEALPRVQKILDALNQDYKNKYPAEFSKRRPEIIVFNPLSIDHESELKNAEAKSKESEIYNKLISEGYDPKLVAKYIKGEIEIDELGVPTKPETPEIPQDTSSQESAHEHKHETNELEKNNDSGLIQQQQGSLKNTVINLERQIVSESLTKLAKSFNALESDEDLVNKTTKKQIINELELILVGFYGIITTLQGSKIMNKRMNQFAMAGLFTLDRVAKSNIKSLSKKVAESHINTVLQDILTTAQEEALKGSSLEEVRRVITQKYSDVISTTRANTIARTETNRAFTNAQYEADRQFLKQNKLEKRAFKQWMTRSDNPCEFCLSLERRGRIPFYESFQGLGSTIEIDGKTLDVKFEAINSGNAHPNCSCIYELIIESAENSIKKEKIELESIEARKLKAEADLNAIKKEIDEIGGAL